MPSLSPPKLFQNDQNIQLSYELPHRIHCALRYPVLAPNGSTVIIYGHDNGLRIIRRGGKPLRPAAAKQNGANDAVVIIDSDDEQEESLEFEDEESDDPIPPIIYHVDLNFGPVLHLAVGSSNNIIIAAACADHVVRLISLPLTPGKSTPDIAPLNGHSSIPDGVAISQRDKAIIVASYSREVNGLLLLHRVGVANKNDKIVLSKENSLPIQTQYLPSPAVSVAFNSSHLLVADKSACRIYSPEQEAWLLTLHPGFGKAEFPNFGRKVIVDAKWVQGKAIMVLLADGEWGIWDIEGSGPGASRGLIGGQTIKGGATTLFTLSGWIEGAPVKPRPAPSKFAPMTPSTRKTAEPVLFSGRYSNASAGQISVLPLPKSTTTSHADESVTLWLEDSYVVIPSLRSYWEAQGRSHGSGNLFTGTPGARTVKIYGVAARGERCVGIDQIPVPNASKSGIPSDLLVVGEHRFIILSNKIPDKARRLQTTSTDLELLAPGEIDVRG